MNHQHPSTKTRNMFLKQEPTMTTQTIEVEVPEGYEAVRFGLPKAGEMYVRWEKVETAIGHWKHAHWPVLIVRKKCDPQITLNPGTWVAITKRGNWLASSCEPVESGFGGWSSEGDVLCLIDSIFSIPPFTGDWRDSKHQIK